MNSARKAPDLVHARALLDGNGSPTATVLVQRAIQIDNNTDMRTTDALIAGTIGALVYVLIGFVPAAIYTHRKAAPPEVKSEAVVSGPVVVTGLDSTAVGYNAAALVTTGNDTTILPHRAAR